MATLSIAPVGTAMLGDAFRCVIANPIGSVTSGAAILNVLSGFQPWSEVKFSAGELLDDNVSGPNADPDHDGLANLVEYALGLEPKTADQTGLPTVSVQGSDWVYTYTRPSDRADLTYEVELSTNLTGWSTSGVAHELVSTSGGTETWRAKYPVGSAANCYFRLKITQP